MISCKIKDNAIYVNNRLVFEANSTDINDFLKSAYTFLELNYLKFFKMDNYSKLACIAAELIFQYLDKNEYKESDIALVFANKSASLDTDMSYFETISDIASPAKFVYTLPNIMMGEICIRHKLKGENAFFVFDSFDGDFLLTHAKELIQNDYCKSCLIGWVEIEDNQYEGALWYVERQDFVSTKTGISL